MQHAQLRYRSDTQRWSITAGGKEHGVHCGESFILNTGGARIPCRLELADTWYVVIDEVTLALRPRQTYAILI